MAKAGNLFVKMETLLRYVVAGLIWLSSVHVLHIVQCLS